MTNAVWIILIIILFGLGFLLGMYLYIHKAKKHFAHHSPISRTQLSELMTEMGRKPSAQQLNRMMNHVNNVSNRKK